MSSPSLAAFLLAALLGVFSVGVTETVEAEGEVNVELEEGLVHRRDCWVDKSMRTVRLPFKPQLACEPLVSLSIPLQFYAERADFNGLGTALRT